MLPTPTECLALEVIQKAMGRKVSRIGQYPLEKDRKIHHMSSLSKESTPVMHMITRTVIIVAHQQLCSTTCPRIMDHPGIIIPEQFMRAQKDKDILMV